MTQRFHGEFEQMVLLAILQLKDEAYAVSILKELDVRPLDLMFTVTTAGTVKDPVVLQSTSSLFERAAIRAVLKFKYKPRVVDGVPVDVPGVKTRISFMLED